MTDRKHILVVDDHFEILAFLRSMLELSSDRYQVVGVPSAEEGFLELQRTPYDLLITDVRLPGIGGFDLVRKVRGLYPSMPVIIITAYASAQGREEARELGVAHYFEKPLDSDALLAAVHGALFVPTPPAMPDTAPLPPAPPPERRRPLDEQPEVVKRLAALKSDTGAAQVFFANGAGDVLYVVGDEGRANRDRLVKIMTETLRSGLRLAAEVNEDEPATMHHQAGKHVDLYGANVGRDAFLILLFDVLARRGRIGTVWVFTQRAIRDLKVLLPARNLDLAAPPPSQLPTVPPQAAQPQAPAPALPASSPVEFPPAGEDASRPAAEPIPVHDEDPELQAMLAQMAETLDDDVEAFWDEVVAEAGDDRAGLGGLSFEEAVRQGLVPPGLGNGEE